MLPKNIPTLIIGAGIHGLSTAYHLALELKASGKGSGEDILIIDKSGVAAGASGIACGVIRNNYFQPAMHELMMHSIETWEKDPEAYSYHSTGYVQISPESMHRGVGEIASRHDKAGFDSLFVEGEEESRKYMLGMFDDWTAEGVTSVLHEKRGGFANNKKSMEGLAAKVRAEGVSIVGGVEVTGFDRAADGSVSAVRTSEGVVACDRVVVGVGPWIPRIWSMLDLPKRITVNGPGFDGAEKNMWRLWFLQEGVLDVDPDILLTNDGSTPPVLHVDSDTPLLDDDGNLVTDEMWGIYYKPDTEFGGVQGGAAPYPLDDDPDTVAIDPYTPESSAYIVGEEFSRMWCAALAHCQSRFKGLRGKYRQEPSGGLGSFTPDSFPVFDTFCENCYIIADSNHGYKMLGVGALVAEELCGGKSPLLEPFRFSRYETGKLHPTSASPFPWS